MAIRFNKDFPIFECDRLDPQIPFVILVDSSESTVSISELNYVFAEFWKALQEDTLTLSRADICIIPFKGNFETEIRFKSAFATYRKPMLSANGELSPNEAISTCLDTIAARIEEYKMCDVPFGRPYVFTLFNSTLVDTERERNAKERLKTAIDKKKVNFIPISINENADVDKIQKYYPESVIAKPVLKVNGDVKEIYRWIAASIINVCNNVGRSVKLPKLPDGTVLVND